MIVSATKLRPNINDQMIRPRHKDVKADGHDDDADAVADDADHHHLANAQK